MDDETVTDEQGLTSLRRRYRNEGATHTFRAGSTGVLRCGACHQETEGHHVPVHAMHRIRREGRGDLVFTVVSCPRCQARGTLLVTQGPASTRDEATLLAALAGQPFG